MPHLPQILQSSALLKAHKNLRESVREEAKGLQQREAAKPEQVEEGGLNDLSY
jgi:hypothetical protein